MAGKGGGCRRRAPAGRGGEARVINTHTHARTGGVRASNQRTAKMADDAASMETDEGGAEMCRALAGAKVSPIFVDGPDRASEWIDRSACLPGSRQADRDGSIRRPIGRHCNDVSRPRNYPTNQQPFNHTHSQRKGMSVGHRHHYHGRGGLSQPQGGRPTSAPYFLGSGGSSSGVHNSYQAYPPHPYQHHHNAPRHRRGGGGHLPLNEVAAPDHAHNAMGGSADGGGSSSIPIPITILPPTPPSIAGGAVVDPSLQSVAPASTVAVASSAGSSSPHGAHHHHRSHHPHANQHRANFPFGGPRPTVLGGSGLVQEGGGVSPLTSPTVSSRSSSASSSASSSSSPFAASGLRALFGGRGDSGGDREEDRDGGGEGHGQHYAHQQRGPRMWRLEVRACDVCRG